MILIMVALFSIMIGSFYNVCIHRMIKGESIVYPSSYCPNCGHPLVPLDLVPILSYVFLLGRCRYCKSKISLRYPMVEIITPILSILLYNTYGLSLQFVGYFIFAGILIIVTFIDIRQQIIPNQMIIIGLISGMLFSLINITTGFLDALLGLILGSGSLLMIALISLLIFKKQGMGGGDIKLLGVIGLFLGWKLTLLTLLFSIYIGGIFSALLLLFKLKKKGEYIPFGPFISLASIIALLWGNGIVQWYVNSFL